MRVVLDLEYCGAGDWESFAFALADGAGEHEVWLALDGEQAGQTVRAAFATVIPRHRIISIAPAGPAAAQAVLRAWSIAALRPDVVLHARMPANTFGGAQHALLAMPGATADGGDAITIAADRAQAAQAWAALLVLAARPRHLPPRRRLAFVTPLPPQRTGIAEYAVQLLPALQGDFDIELVVAQPVSDLPPTLQGLAVRDSAWFDTHAGRYDQIVYQFGNSAYHAHMLDLLERHPGVVVLHDFFLSGLVAYRQVSGAAPRGWTDALFHAHGFGAVRASSAPQAFAQAVAAFPCSLAVIERATGVIVHSAHALTLARYWYGPLAADNWTVVPLPRAAPIHPGRDRARAELGVAEDTFLVCSFGYVAPNKLVHRLLAAWRASDLHGNAACQLVLVGANYDGPYGATIAAAVAAAGARVRIAGWTDQADYHRYLGAADMAVQLRTGSRGETSAAALDCMNAGLATIVNANGAMADLPAGSVLRLDDDFADARLVDALERLHADAGLRAATGARAAALLASHYRPAACARQYRAALDRAMNAPAEAALYRALPAQVWQDEAALQQVAAGIGAAPAPFSPRRLCIANAGSGLDEATLAAMLGACVPGWRTEAVQFDAAAPTQWRYARAWAAALLGIAIPGPDCAPDWQAGDVLCVGAARLTGGADAALAALRARGVEVVRLAHGREDGLAAVTPADRVLCFTAAIAASAGQPGATVYNGALP